MEADLLSRIWSGAMLLLCRGLLWLLVGFSPAAAQVPEDIQQLLQHRGHALLIGVSDYKTGWDQLPSVKNDLHDLKEGLQPYFQTVDTVQSPTVAEIRTKMHDFLLGHWNKPDERLFVYYSGHGFTDFNQNSRQQDGYITGSDTPLYNQADGRAVENAVPFTDVNAWNIQTKARHVLMVFDSCFSGSLFQVKGTKTEPSQYDFDSVRSLLRKPIRYAITAGRQNEQVAADSTFARLLLRGLRGGADFSQQGVISADALGIYLFNEVPRASQRPQTPQYSSLGNTFLTEGQFFFLTALAHPAQAPQPAPAPASQAAQAPHEEKEHPPIHDKNKNNEIIDQISILMDDGGTIRETFLRTNNVDLIKQQFKSWVERTYDYLNKNLGTSYAVQFKNAHGNAMMGFVSGENVEGGGYEHEILGKNQMLNDFIRALRSN